MMLELQSLKIMFVVLLAGASVLAQSPDELAKKYGKPDNHFVRRVGYEVRPGLLMTVPFTPDKQPCEIIIEPNRVTDSGIDLERRMREALTREIIDEVAPMAQRGRLIRAIVMGGYTSMGMEDYEKVRINSVFIGPGGRGDDHNVDEVRIRWKERQCQ